MRNLHLISGTDQMRPAQCYIQLKNENVYATNGHIMFKAPTHEIFPKDILEVLPKECYFLATNWKLSKASTSVFFKFENNMVTCFDRKLNPSGYLPFLDAKQFEDKIGKFPNYEAVIPANGIKEETPKSEIFFNPELLNALYLCNNKAPISVKFYGHTNLVSYKDSESIGILMGKEPFSN